MLSPDIFITYYDTPCMTIGVGKHTYDVYTLYMNNNMSKVRIKADSYDKAMDAICKYYNTNNLSRKNYVSNGLRYYRMLPKIKLHNFTIKEIVIKLIT